MMGYDESDAANDAYIEQLYKEFRQEYGEEIAEDRAANEVIVGVVAAHRIWWPRAQAAVDKAKRRFADAEYDEAVFHIGRAFDGYIKNALVEPVRAVFVERFRRSLPAGFPVKADTLFKSISGLGGTLAFAAYTIALVSRTQQAAEAIIEPTKLLVNGGGAGPTWTERDRAFHAPIDVDEPTARGLLERAEAILTAIVTEVEHRVREEEQAKERVEFSPARVEILGILAAMYDADGSRKIEGFRIPLPYNAASDRTAALASLEEQGYVQRIDGDWSSSGAYRLTPDGREYFRTSVEPRLDKDVKNRVVFNSSLLVT